MNREEIQWDREAFGAFILTYKRPRRVYTYQALRRSGYTGPIYLVVDDKDPTLDEYLECFGSDKILIFRFQSLVGRLKTTSLGLNASLRDDSFNPS